MAGWGGATHVKGEAAPQHGPQAAQLAMGVLSPLLFGHAAAMTLKAAVVLNIPDILARAEPQRSTLSAHEIATELPSDSVDELSLHRIMRALVHLGVFSAEQAKTGSGEPLARYGLTPASRMLVRENNPRSLAPMVTFVNYKNSQTPWQYLHENVLYGKNLFEAAYGKCSWKYSEDDPEYAALWNVVNGVQGAQAIGALKCYDGLKDVKTLVDVGGNKGEAVAAIVAAHPHIRGINFDFPHVVAGAPDVPGVEHIAGNLLETDVPSGDTMLLKNVVHLFNDEDSLKVLQNCKKSLTADGKLLIYDPVIPSESGGESPYTGVPPMLDVALLVHAGGVDRTEEQWRSLVALAGFPNVRSSRMIEGDTQSVGYRAALELPLEAPEYEAVTVADCRMATLREKDRSFMQRQAVTENVVLTGPMDNLIFRKELGCDPRTCNFGWHISRTCSEQGFQHFSFFNPASS